MDPSLEERPTTPGMKYRHYTPDAQVILVHPSAPLDFEIDPNAKVGVMGNTSFVSSFKNCEMYSFGDTTSSQIFAMEIFNALRSLESKGCSVIYVQGIPEIREGLAVMNRLQKAASKEIR